MPSTLPLTSKFAVHDVATIEIQFNGQLLQVPHGTTIARLLEIARIRTEVVAVELNQEIVSRSAHANTIVHAGDSVEAVTLVGGG